MNNDLGLYWHIATVFVTHRFSVALGGTADMNGPASSGNPVEFDPLQTCQDAR